MALLAKHEISPVFEHGRYFLLIAAIVLVSLYGGIGPGFIAILTSVAGSVYFFLEPQDIIHHEASSNYLLLAMFTVVSILTSTVAAKLRKSKQIANQAKETAERAMSARLELLAIVSHDLKNPLTAILLKRQLILKLIESGKLSPALLKVHLESMGSSANQMNRLIQDILDTETLEAGTLKVEKKAESLNLLLDTIDELFEPVAQGKTIDFVVNKLSQPVSVYCDRVRIVQVLSNLVGNAIKFTAAGGRVEVRAEMGPKDEVEFSVCDNGPGIKNEYLPMLFDRHWQAEKTARLGHGLGLFISKGLIEAHEGKVWVESNLGKGSVFHFSLKRAPEI